MNTVKFILAYKDAHFGGNKNIITLYVIITFGEYETWNKLTVKITWEPNINTPES
jgi:hypothetical protein